MYNYLHLSVIFHLSLLFFLAVPAGAVPVADPFGVFPKAIVFDPATVPDSTVSISLSTGGADARPGFIMTPLGDGSWAVSAIAYPGSTYKYYFEYRIPEWEADSTGSFLGQTDTPGGRRNQDANRSRTITLPMTAADGYVVYNAFGDRSVWGGQGADTTLALSNVRLANWRPDTVISILTDEDTGGADGANNSDVSATQVSPSRAQIVWKYEISGDGFAPHVEGATRFLPASLPEYGFEIYRAESNPALALDSLPLTNITASVTGHPVFSDNDNDPFNAQLVFLDTAIQATADSVFIYTIRSLNAYGMRNTFTSQFSWSGGYSPLTWAELAAEVDGAVDLMYGPAIAEDPKGDQSQTNLDLTALWATRDAVNLYTAIEIGEDIFAAGKTWGRYFVLIDVTGDTAGPADLLHADLGDNRKNVSFAGNRPEFALVLYSSDKDNIPPDRADLFRWTGAGWTNLGSQLMATATNSETSWIEAAIPLGSLAGYTGRVWLEAFGTGNDANNLPRDVVNLLAGAGGNNEYNSEEWTSATAAALSVSTPFPPPLSPPIAVSITAIDTRAYFSFRPPAMNPNLFARLDVFFDTDQARVARGDSTVRRASLATDATFFETTGLVANQRYYASVYAVAADGESAGSSVPYCDIRIADTTTTIREDSAGLTIIEIRKSSINPAYAADTYFRIEILNFDELWELANFTDTARLAQLALIAAANEKIFYDPNFNLVSTGNYPDTYSPLRQIRVIRPDGSTAPDDYFIEIRLRIPYLTVDGVHLSGQSLFNENRLVIRKLNEDRTEWVIPDSEKTQWVMVDSNQVVIVTSEFSIWDVLASAGAITNLDRLTVYPNPFNTREYIAKGHPMPPRITFAYIPNSTERIEIFNVAGERVRTLNPQDASEFVAQGGYTIAIWDAKNDYGRDVASGVYVFWVRAAGQTKIGKVAIIR